jgi:hypothetical protein
MLFEQALELENILHTLSGRSAPPGTKRIGSGLYCGVDISVRRKRRARQDLSGRGIRNVQKTGTLDLRRTPAT